VIKRIRGALLVLLFAVVGAAAGRAAAAARREFEAGETVSVQRGEAFRVRVPEVIPGVVASLRVNERPWSYLRIPPWLAAFAVNFALVALARELRPLLRTLTGGGAWWWTPQDEPDAWEPAPPDREDDAVERPARGFAPFED
jgi:hypothetical protein